MLCGHGERKSPAALKALTLRFPTFSILGGEELLFFYPNKLLPNAGWGLQGGEQPQGLLSLLCDEIVSPLFWVPPFLYHGNVATNQLKWQYDDKLV